MGSSMPYWTITPMSMMTISVAYISALLRLVRIWLMNRPRPGQAAIPKIISAEMRPLQALAQPTLRPDTI